LTGTPEERLHSPDAWHRLRAGERLVRLIASLLVGLGCAVLCRAPGDIGDVR
jgi:hypothetical protein